MNQNGGIHRAGFAVLCHRNGGLESPGILIFPKEEELNQKLERLSELNALLNMDEKEAVMEGEEEQGEEKEEHQSLHDRITAIKQNSQRQDGKEPAMRTTEACIG